MSRLDPSNELARRPEYRRFYLDLRRLSERICSQDGCITFLLVELHALQRRVNKLEQRNNDLAAAALRLAHNNAEEIRELEQRP